MAKTIKILSIEDDEFMRIFLKDTFVAHGAGEFSFQMADNLEKAREIVLSPETRPDLIFLDLGLPEKAGGKVERGAGFKFLQELKSNPKTREIKTIVFSSYADKETAERALELGAHSFMLKGEYLPQELIIATKKFLLD